MTTSVKKDKLERIYDVLLPLAEIHTPEGSLPSAVVDQWIHALATNGDLYQKSALRKESFDQSITQALVSSGLYNSQKQFYGLVYRDVDLKPKGNPKFKFIDLFAGIGGMRLGFQAADGACVFSSEFDKHAQSTYRVNYGEMPFGDITKIDPLDIPDHDVLLAGFPCQPFSHAGLKLGIEDTRGTLFHNIAEILKAKKPRFAVLENVKGLVSHDKGHTLKVILHTLMDIGYSCNITKERINKAPLKEIQNEAKKMVLKSVDFGVPQNRQRIYIVLWRDGVTDNFNYPTPTKLETKVSDILEVKPDPKLTISDKLWQGHQRRKVENAKNGKGFGYGIVGEESAYTNTISARYYKDGSEILISQSNANPRKISPREAARLQGFPENFSLNPSNVQAYRQFGNSVSVPVIKSLAKEIVNHLS